MLLQLYCFQIDEAKIRVFYGCDITCIVIEYQLCVSQFTETSDNRPARTPLFPELLTGPMLTF